MIKSVAEDRLKELLNQHGELILPGIGVFTLNHSPAIIDHISKKISPPTDKIGFSHEVNSNHGIHKPIFISTSNPEQFLATLSEEYQRLLQDRRIVEIDALGQLFQDAGKNLHFLKDESSAIEGDIHYLPTLDIEYAEINKEEFASGFNSKIAQETPILTSIEADYLGADVENITETLTSPLVSPITPSEDKAEGFTVTRNFKNLPYTTYKYLGIGLALALLLTFSLFWMKKGYERYRLNDPVYQGSKATSEYPDTGANFVLGDQEIDYSADITVKPEDNVISANNNRQSTRSVPNQSFEVRSNPNSKLTPLERKVILPDSIDLTVSNSNDILSPPKRIQSPTISKVAKGVPVIFVGTFSSPSNVAKMMKKARSKGFDPKTVKSGTSSRVYLNVNRSNADLMLRKVKSSLELKAFLSSL